MSLIEKSRNLAQDYIRSHQPQCAAFWAEKALTLSNGDPNDTVLLAQALFELKQYKRAIHLLSKNEVDAKTELFRYLVAKCHAECEEWSEALEALEGPCTSDMETTLESGQSKEHDGMSENTCLFSTSNLASAIQLLKGYANEALGNVEDAMDCFKACLVGDVFCAEALQRLTHHQYLTHQEEVALLQSLPFDEQCTEEEAKMLRYMYTMMMNDSRYATAAPPPEQCQQLVASPDVQCMKAKQCLAAMDIGPCLDITKHLLASDPYHLSLCETHIQGCLLAKKTEDLYSTAQMLVSLFPQLPLSWFAVACYYLLQSNHNLARKYLEKVLALDKLYSLAWMASGLSFSENGEYDQAITAFSTAAHVMKGSHLPALYLAREYYHTGAGAVATQFLKQAVISHPTSPAVLQEVAVMFYDAERYDHALKYLKQAEANLQGIDPETTISAWEPIYNNLGHTYRKMGHFDMAIEAHFMALRSKPNEASTHTALAFAFLLKGDFERSSEHCYKALGFNRKDTMAMKILDNATEETANMPLVIHSTVEIFPAEDNSDITEESISPRGESFGRLHLQPLEQYQHS